MRKIDRVYKLQKETRASGRPVEAGDPSWVVPVLNEGMERIERGEGLATVKWDGTPLLFEQGRWWKRRTIKVRKQHQNVAVGMLLQKFAPEGFMLTEVRRDLNKILGWVPVDPESPSDQWMRLAIQEIDFTPREGATYELIGGPVEGNPYGMPEGRVQLVQHGTTTVPLVDRSFEGIKRLLTHLHHEGIVFWDENGPFGKIRRRDFGMPWPVR